MIEPINIPRFPRDPVAEIEEIRDLLLVRERQELRNLRDELTNKERRFDDLAAILPEAVKSSRRCGNHLSYALRPVVEGSIRESINKRPEILAEILAPIFGSVIRRSIKQRFRRLSKSLGRAFDHISSWEAMKWRLEAFQTGENFAKVMMRQSPFYRAEEVFLIHRETGSLLLHVTADPDKGEDLLTTASMLSAIQDFTRDSFEVTGGSSVVEFRFRQRQLWIALEDYAYLAAVFLGHPSGEVRSILKGAIERIRALKGTELANFSGDVALFESLRPELESCLISKYGRTSSRTGVASLWAVAAAVAAATVFAIVQIEISELKWKNFIGRLNGEPGIVIISAHKGWFSHSSIGGLRDPLATDPATIARDEKLDPSAIRFQWKPFAALDPATVTERFKQKFSIPSDVRAIVNDGVLTLFGSAPYEWLERARREAPFIPGITSVSDHGVEVVYDPDAVLKHFQDEFGLPGTVYPLLTKNTLTLSGEAPHRWLTRVRSKAIRIPGISSVDDRDLVDLDQRMFQQAKSVLESTSIRFVENGDKITVDGFTVLSLLSDQINRFTTAAKQIGVNRKLEVLGYAGNADQKPNNVDLGQKRANKVRDFFVSCGFDPSDFIPVGIEASSKAGEQKPGPDLSGGYVTFKVVFEETTQSE